MVDWCEGRLGDVIELKRGYDLPERERDAGRFPIVSSGGVSGTHSQFKVRGPGVVTGRYGTLGQVFFVPGDFWPLNTTLYVRDFKGNDPRFISYFLRTIDFLAYSDKAAVPGLNRNHLHQAKIRWPALHTQVAIAQVLTALDSKIDLNREVNETLETMAVAVFRSWFVDFDPIRKRSRAFLDEAVAAFPRTFDGAVPQGWRLGTLDELQASVPNAITAGPFGSKLGRADYVGSGVPVIRGANLGGAPGEWFVEKNFVFVSQAKAEDELRSCWARPGDVLFTQRGTLGQIGLIPRDASYERYIVSQSQMKMTCGPEVPPEFVVLAFKQREALAYIESNAVAAGVPHINLGFLRGFPIIIPSNDVLRAFRSLVEPLHNRMRHNVVEGANLAELRDLLLPRLLSGELRIRDVERLVGAVA